MNESKLIGAGIVTIAVLTAVIHTAVPSDPCITVPYAEEYDYSRNSNGDVEIYDAHTGEYLATEASCTVYEQRTME